MTYAIVFGRWELRHGGQRSSGVELAALDIGLVETWVSQFLDLRRFGLENLQADRSPLALARVDGDAVQLIALLLRQDLHRVQMLQPCPLPPCSLTTLPQTLAALFDRHHLSLNNFECCAHPLPAPSPTARAFSLRVSSIAALTRRVVALLDGGAWPGFCLRSGRPLEATSGEVTLRRSPSTGALHCSRRGTTRKKPSAADPGLQVEVFEADASGTWRRAEVRETPAGDVPRRDRPSDAAAASDAGAPFAAVATLWETQTRIQIECCETGLVVEMELGHREIRSGSTRPALLGLEFAPRSAVLRPTFTRSLSRRGDFASEIGRIASCVLDLPEAAGAVGTESDAPAGYLPVGRDRDARGAP